MKKFIVAIFIGLSLMLSSPSAKADVGAADHYYPPYVWNGYFGGVPWGFGHFNWLYWPVTVAYGYSYWGYYNWAPYYSTYGAIAYSVSTGKFGLAWGTNSRQAANSSAVDFCAEEDCRPVVWVQGGCAALAINKTENRVGWAYGDYKDQARSGALRSCRHGATTPADCKVASWVCSF